MVVWFGDGAAGRFGEQELLNMMDRTGVVVVDDDVVGVVVVVEDGGVEVVAASDSCSVVEDGVDSDAATGKAADVG